MKDTFKITLPVLFGYIPLGMAYALLGVSYDIPAWFLILSSFFVYAGSGQFLLVGLIASGANLLSIFVASFIINVRHIFYTLSLLGELPKSKFKHYIIFALTDESFALLKSLDREKNSDKTYFLVALFNHIYWICGAFLGIVVGKSLDVDYSGIEFTLTALFVVLSIELFKNNKNYKILFLGIFFGVFGLVGLPKEYMLIVTLFFGLITLLSLRKGGYV